MKTDFTIAREDGFTIQELLVTLIVSSLVVAFSLSLFLFAGKLVHSWRWKTELQAAVHGAIFSIGQDILASEQLVAIGDSDLVLQRQNGTVVRYRFHGGAITRDGVPLNRAAEVTIASRIVPSVRQSASGTVQCFKIKVRGTNRSYTLEASADASIPWSSKEEFLRTMRR